MTAGVHPPPGGSGAELTHTVTHPVGVGADRLLLIGLVGWGSGTVAPPDWLDVTWRGERIADLRQFVADKGSGNARRRVRMTLGVVPAPSPGEGELYVRYRLPTGTQPTLAYVLRSYSGVRQRDPVRALVTHDVAVTTTPQTMTVASDRSDLVVDLAHLTSQGIQGAGQALDADINLSGHDVMASSAPGDCDTVGMTWQNQTLAGGVLGFMVASLVAANLRCYDPNDPPLTQACPPVLDDPPADDVYVPWYADR